MHQVTAVPVGAVYSREIYCPAGKEALSGGWSQPFWHMKIYESLPSTQPGTGLKGWYFLVENTNASGNDLTMYVVCATAG